MPFSFPSASFLNFNSASNRRSIRSNNCCASRVVTVCLKRQLSRQTDVRETESRQITTIIYEMNDTANFFTIKTYALRAFSNINSISCVDLRNFSISCKSQGPSTEQHESLAAKTKIYLSKFRFQFHSIALAEDERSAGTVLDSHLC